MFSAMSGSQWVIFFLSTVAPSIVNALIPSGGLHDAVLGVVGAISALLLVLFRKPSAAGGTVATSGK